MFFVFLAGMVAGVCAHLIWVRRKPRSKTSESGSVFFVLFGAVAMVGILGVSVMTLMRGPVASMQNVTKHSIAENHLIASTRLALVSAATQQPDSGDCDGDGFVEPLPYRDPGTEPHPAGGGFIPSTIGASLTDPWGRQYGYCIWDHGDRTVSDDIATCGGATAKRLEGAPTDTQMAVVIISSGKDMIFQTTCNPFADSDADGVPDSPLVQKPSDSDDIILGHTYAEANSAMSGLWTLKPGEPGTATIDKDIDVQGGGSLGGSLKLGGGLLLPDQTSSGLCTEANDQQLRRNTLASPPSLEICDWQGGAGDWVPISSGGSAFGERASKLPDIAYYAETDGIVTFYTGGSADAQAHGCAGSAASNVMPCYVAGMHNIVVRSHGSNGASFPVRKGEYWAVEIYKPTPPGAVVVVFWTPLLESGTLPEDTTPDAFDFTDVTGAALGTVITSNIVTITGVSIETPVSVSGVGSPQIRINGGSWVTSGVITKNQTIEVRLTSANTDSTTRSADVTVGTVMESWNVRTIDTTPDPFSFTDVTLAAFNTLTTSNAVTITGIDTATPVSVTGAGSPQIRINGGSWVTSGTITDGQSLQVRLTSANTSATANAATVTVGTVSDNWSVTTIDITPNAFSFTDVTGVNLNTLTTSNTITISGIDTPTSVSVSGDGSPRIRINGGAWVTSGTITSGQSLAVRLTSANAGSTARSATVTVGSVTDNWSVTTKSIADTTPDDFNFTDVSGAVQRAFIISDTITISGIDTPTSVSVSGDGSPQVSINGGAWVTSGTITNGQSLAVRLTSADADNTMRLATVTVGGVTDNWEVTTAAGDPCTTGPIGTVCTADGAIYIGDDVDDDDARIYAAPEDQDTSLRWKTFDNYTVGAADYTDGPENTNDMIAAGGASHPAANSCNNKAPAGTWYLPAVSEFLLVWENRAAIDPEDKGFSVGSSDWYWSSTQHNVLYSWRVRVDGGSQNPNYKTGSNLVRCFRR